MKALLLVLLLAVPVAAGPITSSDFHSTALPPWASGFVPGDALTLDNGPFSFADADGEWQLLTERSECGGNRTGWAGDSTSGLLFDQAAVPGATVTIEVPELIAFTYQIGDGDLWLSDDDYLHFTLWRDDDAYYVGMTGGCVEETPGVVIPRDDTGAGDERAVSSTPSTVHPRVNVAIIRFVIRRIPPETPASVPEPWSVVLIGTALIGHVALKLWRHR